MAYLDFPHESALWPSDGDLLLITFTTDTSLTRCACLSQLLSYRNCDFISIYRAALLVSRVLLGTVVDRNLFLTTDARQQLKVG